MHTPPSSIKPSVVRNFLPAYLGGISDLPRRGTADNCLEIGKRLIPRSMEGNNQVSQYGFTGASVGSQIRVGTNGDYCRVPFTDKVPMIERDDIAHLRAVVCCHGFRVIGGKF